MWSHMEVDCIIIHCTHLSYHCPRNIAFIDLTKAFKLVIRKGLFTLPQTMVCPPPQAPKDDHVFPPLNLRPLPNQELSETGLCTRFHTLRQFFLPTAILRLQPEKINGVYLHTRSDGNISRLRANTKVQKVLIREMLS